MRAEEIMIRLFMTKKPFQAFMAIQYGDSSTIHDIYVGGSLNCYGRLISSRRKQFIYINSRLSSSHVEENYTVHYVLEFADKIDIRTQYADEFAYAARDE